MGGGDGVNYVCNYKNVTKIKMKNSMKFLVGGLAGVVVLGAVYFGAFGRAARENCFE